MYDEPPSGWYVFGTHDSWHEDDVPPLVYSAEVDDAGTPLWERPAHEALRLGGFTEHSDDRKARKILWDGLMENFERFLDYTTLESVDSGSAWLNDMDLFPIGRENAKLIELRINPPWDNPFRTTGLFYLSSEPGDRAIMRCNAIDLLSDDSPPYCYDKVVAGAAVVEGHYSSDDIQFRILSEEKFV